VLKDDGAIPYFAKAVLLSFSQNRKIYVTLPKDAPHGTSVTVTNLNIPSGNVLASPGHAIVGYSKVSLRPENTTIFVRLSKTLWVVK